MTTRINCDFLWWFFWLQWNFLLNSFANFNLSQITCPYLYNLLQLTSFTLNIVCPIWVFYVDLFSKKPWLSHNVFRFSVIINWLMCKLTRISPYLSKNDKNPNSTWKLSFSPFVRLEIWALYLCLLNFTETQICGFFCFDRKLTKWGGVGNDFIYTIIPVVNSHKCPFWSIMGN